MMNDLVVQFVVQPPVVGSLAALFTLGITGALIVVVAFVRARGVRGLVAGRFVALLAIGFVVIGVGVGVYFLARAPATITVGNGYVDLQSSSIFGTGNVNVTSGQIVAAKVVLLGSGNWTLSKQHGANDGSLDIGVFTMANGATAYVITDSPTAIAVHLSSGQYVIIGTSSMSVLTSEFSRLVHPVENSSTV